MVTEEQVEEMLCDFFHEVDNDWRSGAVGAEDVQTVGTFASAGVLTYDKGVVVRFEDGSEFQITIVQSERSDDETAVE
jgi:hypothetical protein